MNHDSRPPTHIGRHPSVSVSARQRKHTARVAPPLHIRGYLPYGGPVCRSVPPRAAALSVRQPPLRRRRRCPAGSTLPRPSTHAAGALELASGRTEHLRRPSQRDERVRARPDPGHSQRTPNADA